MVSASTSPSAASAAPGPAATIDQCTHPFNPDEPTTASLLKLLSDPYYCLYDVAHTHNISLATLTAWMARPYISAQLDSLESAGARHSRLAAVNFLPNAVTSLLKTIRAHTDAEDHAPAHPDSPAGETRRRLSKDAYRASWLLLRIARFYSGPPSPRSPGGGTEARRVGEGLPLPVGPATGRGAEGRRGDQGGEGCSPSLNTEPADQSHAPPSFLSPLTPAPAPRGSELPSLKSEICSLSSSSLSAPSAPSALNLSAPAHSQTHFTRPKHRFKVRRSSG